MMHRLALVVMTIGLLAPEAGAQPTGSEAADGEGRGAPAAPVAPSVPAQLLPPVKRGLMTTPSTGRDRKASPAAELGALRESKDGSGDLLYDEPGFSARIARDGAVSFHDKRLTVLSLLPFLPVAAPRNVPSLQSTISGLLRHDRAPVADPGAVNDSSFLVIPLLTPYRPDPREACRACSVPLDFLPVGLTGTFDVTDELIRMSHHDPYRYAKARFLVATRELRVQKAARIRADNVRRAASDLHRQLMEIACDGRRSSRERRQIIEQLREDLDDTTPEGHSAVAAIRQFVDSRFEGNHDNDHDGEDVCPSSTTAPAPAAP